jgi:hypothetical protein
MMFRTLQAAAGASASVSRVLSLTLAAVTVPIVSLAPMFLGAFRFIPTAANTIGQGVTRVWFVGADAVRQWSIGAKIGGLYSVGADTVRQWFVGQNKRRD